MELENRELPCAHCYHGKMVLVRNVNGGWRSLARGVRNKTERKQLELHGVVRTDQSCKKSSEERCLPQLRNVLWPWIGPFPLGEQCEF